MIKLAKLARIVTYFLLIGVLLFVYANLPARVNLLYNSEGQVEFFLEKNDFFYASLILSLVLNLVITMAVKLLEPLPIAADRFFYSTESFRELFLTWLASLAPVVNLFFVFVIAFIGIQNNGDQELIASYGYLAYLGQFLVFGWLISLIFIVTKRRS